MVLWKALVPEDLLEQCLSNMKSGRETRERDKTAGFRESVHNHQNGGEIRGEISVKINGQMRPGILRYGKGKEFTCWSVLGDLVWVHTEQELT